MKKKILLVDDCMSIRLVMGEMLRDFYEVETCANGQEAVDFVRENEMPDVVVMDLQMPVMDGKEASRILMEEFPGIKILIHTGSGEPAPYGLPGLTKPATFEQLLSILELSLL